MLVLATVTLLVLGSWVVVSHGSSDVTDALRTAGLVFVAINGAPIHVAGAWLTIPLLGLAVLPIVVVRWALGRALRSIEPSSDALVGALIGTSISYGLMVGLVAWLSLTSTASSPPARAGGWGAAVAIAGVLWATKAYARIRSLASDWAPDVRATWRAAGIAMFTILGVSAIVVCASLVMNAGTVITLYDSLHPGLNGALVIFLLGVGWLPAVIGWAWAYLVGSGFAFGTGTSVLPGSVHLGAVPAFPWLGALPAHPIASGTFTVLVAVGAGLLMYPVLSRSGGRAVGQALGASVLVAIAGAALAWIGHGSVGPGHLTVVGALPLTTGLRTFAFVFLGAATAVGLRTIVRIARTQVIVTQDEVPSRVKTAA